MVMGVGSWRNSGNRKLGEGEGTTRIDADKHVDSYLPTGVSV